MILFKNSQGKPDFLMTASVLATSTVLFKTLASGAVIFGHNLGTMDPTLAGVLLTSTLGTYTWKRTNLAKKDAP